MNKPFTTRTFGKWILAGEHAVLRGHPALAFPLTSRFLELTYEPHPNAFDVQFKGEFGADLKLLFYGVLENAAQHFGIAHPLTGSFKVESSLPVGAGLGASAALCGAVGRWCHAQGWVAEDEVYEFARRLEDLFHGESSGVDLAVSLSGRGIRFVRGGDRKDIQIKWEPSLYLSYSGRRGMTAECVAKVKRLFETDFSEAEKLDQNMHRAVDLAERGLGSSRSVGLMMLKESLELASTCFEEWGLCHDELAQHLRHVLKLGALAAKPTGSGGGGYVLSLWRDEPPVSLRPHLVPAFR